MKELDKKIRLFFTKLIWKYPKKSKTINCILAMGLLVGFFVILVSLESGLYEAKIKIAIILTIIWGWVAITWWKTFATHHLLVKDLLEYQIEQAKNLLKPRIPKISKVRRKEVLSVIEEAEKTRDVKKLKDWLWEDHCKRCQKAGGPPRQQELHHVNDIKDTIIK